MSSKAVCVTREHYYCLAPWGLWLEKRLLSKIPAWATFKRIDWLYMPCYCHHVQLNLPAGNYDDDDDDDDTATSELKLSFLFST